MINIFPQDPFCHEFIRIGSLADPGNEISGNDFINVKADFNWQLIGWEGHMRNTTVHVK